MTGDICSREVKIKFKVNVMRLPLKIFNSQIEFPGLPEKEIVEIVTQIENPTNKTYMVELIPPKHQLSGIMITPVVMQIPPQKSNLVSIKYKSEFRDFNAFTMETLQKEEDKLRRKKEAQGLIREDGEEEEQPEKALPDVDVKTKKRRNKKLGKELIIYDYL